MPGPRPCAVIGRRMCMAPPQSTERLFGANSARLPEADRREGTKDPDTWPPIKHPIVAATTGLADATTRLLLQVRRRYVEATRGNASRTETRLDDGISSTPSRQEELA